MNKEEWERITIGTTVECTGSYYSGLILKIYEKNGDPIDGHQNWVAKVTFTTTNPSNDKSVGDDFNVGDMTVYKVLEVDVNRSQSRLDCIDGA